MRIFQSEQVIKFSNVLVSLEKSNGHQIRQISNNWIVMLLGPMPGHYQKYTQNRSTLPSWRLPVPNCYRYGMICGRSSLMAILSFRQRFGSVLLQLVDILLNTQFQHRDGSWHSLLKRLNCCRKKCVKSDSIFYIKYSGRDCMFTWKVHL